MQCPGDKAYESSPIGLIINPREASKLHKFWYEKEVQQAVGPQLDHLLVVVVERRQNSWREGREERDGPSQAAADRHQESGKHLREREGTAGRNGRVKPRTERKTLEQEEGCVCVGGVIDPNVWGKDSVEIIRLENERKDERLRTRGRSWTIKLKKSEAAGGEK